MNRIEYMTKLASLLQDIPEEERKDAMKYYNDYFDEAGEENEEQVVEELGRPEDVAANIKEDILDRAQGTIGNQAEKAESWKERFQNMDSTTRIVLIVAAIIVTLPITLPVIGGIFSAVFGIIVTVFSMFFGLVAASIAVLVAGVVLAVVGIALLISNTAAGLVIMGVGLILVALGLLATVGSIKLCTIVFPAIVRGIKKLWNKIAPRKAVA